MSACGFDGCEKPSKVHGLCSGHNAQRSRGVKLSPLDVRHFHKTISDRLLLSSEENGETLCWNWTRGTASGYGKIRVNGRSIVAHRVAYEEWVQPISTGMVIDHICGNRSCINPEHLRMVTRMQNSQYRVTPQPGNKSGHRGVSFHEEAGKWVARVSHEKKTYYLGLHATAEEAAEAALNGRRELFGEFGEPVPESIQ